MILAKSPLRVSWFGGGSDVPRYYSNYGGATLSAAIDKYVYVAVMHTPHDHIKVSYSKQELVYNVDDVQNDIVKNALKFFGIKSNVEITSFSDIPTIGSGLGGSSAFTCALVAALSSYCGGSFSTYDIAQIACYIEIEMCQWNIGKQDQYASAFGGLNYITYDTIDCVDEILVTKLPNPEMIHANCILVPTNEVHCASDVIDTYKFDVMSNLEELGDIARSMSRVTPTLEGYADALKRAWETKRLLSGKVTNPAIDTMINKAYDVGASACKLLGAGGGGYILVMAEDITKVKIAFPDRVCLTFNISEEGTKVVYRD